jgi:hypothetical protein
LLNWKGEVGIRKRLVLQRKVPPLGIEGLEAMTEHRLTQDHAVLELLGGDAAFRIDRTFAIVACVLTRLRIAAEVGMTLGTEPVEGSPHVKFLLRRHVEQRQVKSGAARMTAL